MSSAIGIFAVSAVFHYLGPSFAVFLFGRVSVFGVAWLRIASAAAVFTLWRRPLGLDRSALPLVVAFGITIAAMNLCFYVAIARLPLATVGAIEFLGPILLAALGSRTPRNAAALALTLLGIAALTQVRFAGQPLGFVFAFANCALFVAYVVLAHRIANHTRGIDGLAAAMLVAAIVVTPIGVRGAAPALTDPLLLLAGIGVGICSSVVPYVMDQLAMARLPRATIALMLSLLPLFAVVIGAVVLRQIPRPLDFAGIACVVCGLALHRVEPQS